MTGTLSPAKVAQIRSSFAAQGLMVSLGAELVLLSAGCVSVAAPIRAETSQQHGFAHAGLTFALGDSAAGYAALSLMPDGAEVLTVEMKINLIAPAAGDRLVATGSVVRAGRRLVVVGAEVMAEASGQSRLVALLQGTMIPA
ncbi:MAG: PaaI family thioesterase [Rhodobacteraceae bacterium]|jgi:uncharacterized protein (TIGR00369 family)|nr:PaaI family thioesterase [Paracoccaceae bacterium]